MSIAIAFVGDPVRSLSKRSPGYGYHEFRAPQQADGPARRPLTLIRPCNCGLLARTVYCCRISHALSVEVAISSSISPSCKPNDSSLQRILATPRGPSLNLPVVINVVVG